MKTFLTLIMLMAFSMNSMAGDIYVSTTGSDKANGSKQSPLKTLTRALRLAREWRRTDDPRVHGGINIHLAPGVYVQDEALYLRPEDSGTSDSPTVIKSDDPEQAVISGGDEPSRRLSDRPDLKMQHIIDFSKDMETITIPYSALADFGLSDISRCKDYEMIVHQRWAIAILRMKNISVSGEEAIVSFMNPESRWEFAHPWPQPVINGERGSSSFAIVKRPQPTNTLSRIMLVEGSPAARIENITFENLTFRNASWLRPETFGHVTLQGGFPILDAYKLTEHEGLPWAKGLENQAWVTRPEAAVTVRWADNVNFKGCTFTGLASTGLDYEIGCHNININGNKFEDIGGTALMCGSFAEGPTEVHHPYVISGDSLCTDFEISNNIVNNVTNEDWGAVGIGCGYVADFNIHHNKVSNVNYSGIAIGWGWTPQFTGMKNNRLEYNEVSDYAERLYDAGGLYTMSNQPGSYIRYNKVSAAYPSPYATNFRAFPIYFDACTDGYTVNGNNLKTSDIVKEKYGWNTPGPAMNVEK